jgi:hypothetical protein
MRLNVTFQSNYVVDAVMGALRPESRAEVYSVAGRAVMNHVQRHIRSYMRTKHTSAHMLGARPTGHYEKGAAAITSTADSSGAVVRIPIPGIDRAWNDIQIRPGPGKRALTLPRAAIAYGLKVKDVEKDGWKVFRPKGTNWLMGTKGDDKTTLTLLYTLVGGVVQRRDPSLLPSQGEIAETGWNAIWKHIQKAVAKARQGGLK